MPENLSPTTYFLPHTAQKIAEIQTGNAHRATERDMSMRKREYWETRTSPAKPHHWTCAEYAQHLVDQNYPRNTLRDRKQHHLQLVCDALIKGDYIPPAVMFDPGCAGAISDAVMHVIALDQGAAKAQRQREAISQFETAMRAAAGTHEADNTSFVNLLHRAALAPAEPAWGEGWLTGTVKTVKRHGYPRALHVGMREGANGKRWLEIRDSSCGTMSLYGELARRSFADIESIYRGLAAEGLLANVDAQTVLGKGWLPFTRVNKTTAAELMAA